MTLKMRNQLLISVIFIVICLGVMQAQLPAPSRQLGYKFGNPAAPVFIEMFADLQCPDCSQSFPVVQKVAEYFGEDNVYLVLHIIPLWLHRQATDAAKAAAAIIQYVPDQMPEVISYFFEHQALFYNSVFANQTEVQLIDLFTTFAANFSMTNATFQAAYNGDSAFTYVQYEVHFGISRQVSSTPTFWINGFYNSTLDETTTYDEWVVYIANLLKGTAPI